MDLVKNCVIGQDTVNPEGNLKKNLIDALFVSIFICILQFLAKEEKWSFAQIPDNKKMFFSHKGGNLTP